MSALPSGPIGFRVHGVGYSNGNQTMTAEVAVQGRITLMRFYSKLGEWFVDGHRLNSEEKAMLDEIWEKQTKVMGVRR